MADDTIYREQIASILRITADRIEAADSTVGAVALIFCDPRGGGCVYNVFEKSDPRDGWALTGMLMGAGADLATGIRKAAGRPISALDPKRQD